MDKKEMTMPDRSGYVSYLPDHRTVGVFPDAAGTNGTLLNQRTAREIAQWILDNVPEYSAESLAKRLARDVKLDRLAIEKALFNKMYSGYDNASIGQLTSTFNLYHCLGMITGTSNHTEDDQKEYLRCLVESFPDWLRAKYGHDKGGE